MHRAQSGATTLDQSGPGSNGNEGVRRIPQISSITGTSPSDSLVSYPGHNPTWVYMPLKSNHCALWLAMWRTLDGLANKCLVSLFNGISIFVGYLMSKTSLKNNSSDAILSIAGGIRGLYLSQERLIYNW